MATANAQEQPKAEQLVAKSYVGLHGSRINTDDDRLIPNSNDFIKHASGVGAEVGHRFSEMSELRLSYTNLNLTSNSSNSNTPSGSNIALNYLYFPNKENFYLMAGLSSLDVVEDDISVNVGAGYRHYISNRSALYFEGNGHYQVDSTFSYTDVSAQIGFIYFFGDNSQKVVRNKPAIQPAPKVPPVPTLIDTDGDGISDEYDQCNATPIRDKVDNNGCTLFTEENDELNLHVKFENAQAVIKPQYIENIKVAADFLKKYPHTSLTIEGHTSSQGPAAYNKRLSQQRAEAIVTVLVTKFGIEASRLTAKGMGEEVLLNPENSEQAHAENRRIDAKVSVKSKVAIER